MKTLCALLAIVCLLMATATTATARDLHHRRSDVGVAVYPRIVVDPYYASYYDGYYGDPYSDGGYYGPPYYGGGASMYDRPGFYYYQNGQGHYIGGSSHGHSSHGHSSSHGGGSHHHH